MRLDIVPTPQRKVGFCWRNKFHLLINSRKGSTGEEEMSAPCRVCWQARCIADGTDCPGGPMELPAAACSPGLLCLNQCIVNGSEMGPKLLELNVPCFSAGLIHVGQ